jgi:hypothetical protein
MYKTRLNTKSNSFKEDEEEVIEIPTENERKKTTKLQQMILKMKVAYWIRNCLEEWRSWKVGSIFID